MVRCPYAQNRYCVHSGNWKRTSKGRRICRYKNIADCPLIKDHEDGKKIIELLAGPLKTSKGAKPRGGSKNEVSK